MGQKHGKKGSCKDISTQQTSVVNVTERNALFCIASNDVDVFSGDENGDVEIFEISTLRARRTLKTHKATITQLDVCKDILFTASRDKTVSFKHLSTEQGGIFVGHSLAVTCLSSNADGTQLVSGSRDCSVAMWDVPKETQIKSEKIARNIVTDMKWNPDLHLVCQCSEDKTVKLWDARSLSVTSTFPMKQYFQSCCDFSTDNAQIITGSVGANGNGCELNIWDLRQVKLLTSLKGHGQNVTSCVYFGSGNKGRIFTSSNDCTVRIWDPTKKVFLHQTYIDGASCVTGCVIKHDGRLYMSTLKHGVHMAQYNSTKECLTLLRSS